MSEEWVWRARERDVYHRYVLNVSIARVACGAGCSPGQELSLLDAERQGLRPCKRCWRPVKEAG